ncbi:RNA-binding cell elongation regulator Jag/EloR [Pontibacillus salicampi]|uniref:RNA-binding protein KhpB n=1 Tax=Pontibacillus salicampi TaxID=1449801 RepID=A0ABV6LU74_9BACI
MRQVTATGQTVEDAVRSALEQLNTSRDQVNVEIIDEGKKGFLGIFGTKPAIVKVSVLHTNEENASTQKESHNPTEEKGQAPKQEERVSSEIVEEPVEPEPTKDTRIQNAVEETQQYIKEVAAGMGAEIEVRVHPDGKEVTFELVGDKIAMLIGKRGQTLNALQYLSQIVINRESETYLTAIVDAEGYRGRREETLKSLAHRLASKAIRTKNDVALEAMPSYERKIIHNALQNNKQITTYSDGTEPHRHVVIKPK